MVKIKAFLNVSNRSTRNVAYSAPIDDGANHPLAAKTEDVKHTPL